MSDDAITRAMEAVQRAAALVTDWDVQRRLLAAFTKLSEARSVLRATAEQSLRGQGETQSKGART